MFTLPPVSAKPASLNRSKQSGPVASPAGSLNRIASDTLSLSHKAAPRFGAALNPEETNNLRLVASQGFDSAKQLRDFLAESQDDGKLPFFSLYGLHRLPSLQEAQKALDAVPSDASTAQTAQSSASAQSSAPAKYKLKEELPKPRSRTEAKGRTRKLYDNRYKILSLLNEGKKIADVEKIMNFNKEERLITYFKRYYLDKLSPLQPRQDRQYRLKEFHPEPYTNTFNAKLFDRVDEILDLLNQGNRQEDVAKILKLQYPDLGITEKHGIRDFVKYYLTFEAS